MTGPGRDDTIKPQVVTAADRPGPFGLVLLSVKATGLAAALAPGASLTLGEQDARRPLAPKPSTSAATSPAAPESSASRPPFLDLATLTLTLTLRIRQRRIAPSA